jgi:CBS domain-containing protein
LGEFSPFNLFIKRHIVSKAYGNRWFSRHDLGAKGLCSLVDCSKCNGFWCHPAYGWQNIGALPVVDNGELVGIISERDYTRQVSLKGKSSKDTPVREIMTQELVTANSADTVSECMRVMTDSRIRHLPVTEGKKMIGLISLGDLVKWIISAQMATIDALEEHITGGYDATRASRP